MTEIYLATEDELSEKLGTRIAGEVGLKVHTFIRRNGAGYLRSRIKNFCELARKFPIVLITDLDAVDCPATLMRQWFGGNERPNDFVFRISVREIESWVLADHQGIYELMGDRIGMLPDQVDLLVDPKRELLDAASRAHRSVREELIAKRGAIASQGIGYNKVLGDFVQNVWSLERAYPRSPSLQRALLRLQELRVRLTE